MSEYEIDGFQQFSNPRFVGKGNRGTILFIRSDLEANLYNRMNDRSCKEACWCEVNLNSNDKLLNGIVYNSPNSPDENNRKLNDLISALNNEPLQGKLLWVTLIIVRLTGITGCPIHPKPITVMILLNL